MDNDRLTLQAIAQRASDRNGGVRGRALDRVAKKAGLALSYTTVDRILTGTYTSTPSRKTLEALAVLAGLDAKTVYRAAGLPVPMGSLAEQLPPDADLLDGPQRDAVIAVVRQFVAAQKALHNPEELMGNAVHPATNTDDDPDAGGGVVIEFEPPNSDPFGDDLDALPDERDEQPPVTGRSTGKAARRTDDEPT